MVFCRECKKKVDDCEHFVSPLSVPAEGRGSGVFVYRRANRAPTKTLQSWLDEAFAEAQEFARRIPAGRFDSSEDYEEQETYTHTRTLRFKVSFRI